MENPNNGTPEKLADHYDDNRGGIEFEYEIAIVDGEGGRRLAVIQVESILEVVEWFSRHPSRPTTTT